jgi:protoporphyrinogen oxidase
VWGIAGKVLRGAVGRGPAEGQGRVFHYPRRGFGQIAEALARAATDAGARIQTSTAVASVRPLSSRVAVSTVDGDTVMAGHVLSTVPLPALARLARPRPPESLLADADRLRFRAMVLVYLVHGGGRWTPYDAHYLPGPETPVTRLSEPANYRLSADDPTDRTVLCAEIPCAVGDRVWTSGPDELAALVTAGLAATGLPEVRLVGVQVRRLSHVYPVYEIGYARRLAGLDSWADGLDRVTTFGRLGLFAHDNTHHALAEAFDAVAALRPDGTRDPDRWAAARARFAAHVVED